MKVIIAGSRHFHDMEVLEQATEESGFDITKVISGCAKGVDTLGEKWAKARGIPVERHPAQWERFGRAAGPKRNAVMAHVGEALIALLAPRSRGTRDMINKMERAGKPVFVKEIGGEQ